MNKPVFVDQQKSISSVWTLGDVSMTYWELWLIETKREREREREREKERERERGKKSMLLMMMIMK